jgi:class 3 adenylate cyclase
VNAGEVIVRAIGNDLHMDYSAIGQTTHLAARMEQMAMPGSTLMTQAVLSLAEGYVQVSPRSDQCPSKGSTHRSRFSSWLEPVPCDGACR